MTELGNLINPILTFVAIVLTFIASYTGLDLYTLSSTADRDKRFLFWGGTFSLGVGIWVMNFMGMIALNMNGAATYHIPYTVLSFILGIIFTGIAFYWVVGREFKWQFLLTASLFMTLAVLSIHITGMYAIDLKVRYSSTLFLISAIIIFCSFGLSIWFLFFSKSLSRYNENWKKPISALVITAAIFEGYFFLRQASSTLTVFEAFRNISTVDAFLFYLVFFALILILSGVIGSRTVVSKRLAESHTSFRDFKAAIDESSIVTISNVNGIITYVNDKFVEVSQYEKDEIIGKSHRVLNSGYHSKAFFEDLWSTISSGNIWRGKIRNRRKDGGIYWVETTIVPVTKNNREPYQYISIRSDITTLKNTEEHLKETIKEVSDIKFALDQSSIVAITDERGIITNVNDKFCEISKYSREELIGQNHSMLNSRVHSKDFFRNLWSTIRKGEVWKGEVCNRAKDGSSYWVDTTIVPFLNDAGIPYQYLAIRNDITEKKKTEVFLHRQDKLATVGQLAAGVAHEIRNPLTSIRGYTEFLQMDETSKERLEYYDIVLEELDRVNNIVEDFMMLAKPNAFVLEEKNIIQIIKDVLSLFELEAKKNNIHSTFEFSSDIILIACDENRLKQVFINFVKNAIEAMPAGGNLTIRVQEMNNLVHIYVTDTGVGIPLEKLERIGEPFYTTKKNGNGLGLMVTFHIIENHSGKINVDSEINKGTTFHIEMPRIEG